MNIEVYMRKYHPAITDGIYEAFNKGDAPWIIKGRIDDIVSRLETRENAYRFVDLLFERGAQDERAS